LHLVHIHRAVRSLSIQGLLIGGLRRGASRNR
jgi:hypothetical protein